MNNITLALQITALGMGLVFAAILLLWGLMILITRLTTDKDASSSLSMHASDSAETVTLTPGSSAAEIEHLAQAAAVGVAIAMAEQQLSSAHPLAEPPTAIVSAWQLGMRTRQMTQKGGRHR